MGCFPSEHERLTTDEILDFVHVVTHDLRSPLVNIRALAGELTLAVEDLAPLQKALDAAVTPQEREQMLNAMRDIPETLRHIEASVLKMDRLMNGLTRLAQITHRPMQSMAVDLGEVVNRIVQVLASEWAKKSCDFEIGTLPVLRGDPVALEQIFSLLLENAVKFLCADRPGKVTVLSRLQPHGYQISITDNGRGIAEKDLARIFTPFRRAGKLDTIGEGMGLPTARALARQLGGTISCESVPGEGSRFTVMLPSAGAIEAQGNNLKSVV